MNGPFPCPTCHTPFTSGGTVHGLHGNPPGLWELLQHIAQNECAEQPKGVSK